MKSNHPTLQHPERLHYCKQNKCACVLAALCGRKDKKERERETHSCSCRVKLSHLTYICTIACICYTIEQNNIWNYMCPCTVAHTQSCKCHASQLGIRSLLFWEDLTIVCVCGKLGIKHAPAPGKHRGPSKGQFVSFNCCLSACLPNRIKLCRSFAFLKSRTVLHKNTVDVITIGRGLVQNNRIAVPQETPIHFFAKAPEPLALGSF